MWSPSGRLAVLTLPVAGLAFVLACASDPAHGTDDVATDAGASGDGTIGGGDGAVPPLDGATAPDGAREAAAEGGDAAVVDPFPQTLVGGDVPDRRVGMFYLVWHAPAADAMRQIAASSGVTAQHSIEDVLRSKGALKFSDIYEKFSLEGPAMALYYNVTPKLGYYCIYRARTGETGWVPDCANISATLATHAEQLIAAGIDHVVVDATNLTDIDRPGDLLQLRPTEVLFEEWAKLRAAGKKTPQIAVWNAVPAGAVQFQKLLALYQNPAYDGLALRDKKTGKKVFFVVDSADGRGPAAANLATITSNGGKNDVEVQRMWTIDKTDPAIDRWAFMSYCAGPNGPTTSIVGAGACNQPITPKSTLGSAVAVAPSFQVGYGSLPNGAAGKLGGVTFKRQWATALGTMPDWVLVSGWNEFVAQPQTNPFTNDPFARDVGLELDPEGNRLFVDTFGADLGRDLEPTAEYGSAYYDLLASCVRVFRANAAGTKTGCNAAAEACCDPGGPPYVNVYTLRNDGAVDVLLTTSASEKAALVGSGWREVCTRYGASSIFCTKGSEPSTPLSPFVAFSTAGAGRHAVMRCLAGTKHFYTVDPACEGQTAEAAIAYFADAPTGEMPRRAERCYFPGTGEHTLALGAACPAGANDEGTLGYVR
jgi:hypothetical protein